METKENEKLLALTKLIGRKDLNFGLILYSRDSDYIMITGSIEADNIYSRDYTTAYIKPYNNVGTPDYKIRLNEHEVIGHPLLLSDILNGLSKKGINYCIGGDYFYCGYDDFYKNDDFFNYYSNMIELDLSLPLFSQQSEEFKEFIFDTFNI